ADRAGLDPDFATEGVVTIDFQPRPPAMLGNPEHIGHRVGVGPIRAQAATLVAERRVGGAVVAIEAFGSPPEVPFDQIAIEDGLRQIALGSGAGLRLAASGPIGADL